MLELKLFGSGHAHYGDRVLSGFPQQQAHHLLCYLVLNRHQLHRREYLAAQFWGDDPTSVSLKRLRNSLWQLRYLLQATGAPPDEYLVIRDDELGFSPASSYRLDVEAFERAIVRCQQVPGQKLLPEQAAGLEAALKLYTGDLLSGLYLDWCLVERERLSLLYLATLCKLICYHEVNGTYECGLDLGRRVLAIDDTRESVHRQMMRLYWLMGDRNAALLQYKRCAQILREALNVAPMAATRHLYRQVMSGESAPPLPSRSPGALPLDAGIDEGAQLQVEHALRSLQRLQATLHLADVELRCIAQLLDEISSQAQRRANTSPETLEGRRPDASLL